MAEPQPKDRGCARGTSRRSARMPIRFPFSPGALGQATLLRLAFSTVAVRKILDEMSDSDGVQDKEHKDRMFLLCDLCVLLRLSSLVAVVAALGISWFLNCRFKVESCSNEMEMELP